MERFLISVLWINVVLIITMWFFNWFFGFSIVARSHWRYLSELQVSGTVEPKFYIAILIFGFLALVGLYLLIFPWHRKIRFSGVSNSQVSPMVPVSISPTVKNNLPENPPEKLEFTRFQKPPKLNLNNIFIPTMTEKENATTTA